MKTCVHYGVHGEDEIKVHAPKGLSAPAAIPLLGRVLSSRDEGRVIDEMLFKDLTSHLMMPSMWVLQPPPVDNLRVPVY